MNKLIDLMDAEDIEIEEAIQIANDAVMPGICMNKNCDHITQVEPDQTKGWCTVCSTGTVKSLQILLLDTL